MKLSDQQLDRYARHIVLRDIGGAGQSKLLSSHVLLIGAGGIGCPAIQYLAGAGVGTISVVDDDIVCPCPIFNGKFFTAKTTLGRRKSMPRAPLWRG